MVDQKGSETSQIEKKVASSTNLILSRWIRFFKDYGFFFLLLWVHFLAEGLIFNTGFVNKLISGSWPYWVITLQFLEVAYVIYYLPFYFFIRKKRSSKHYLLVTISIACIWWAISAGGALSGSYTGSNKFGYTHIDGTMTVNGFIYSLFSAPLLVVLFAALLLIKDRFHFSNTKH